MLHNCIKKGIIKKEKERMANLELEKKAKLKRKSGMKGNTLQMLLFCLPAALCIFVFSYLPLPGLILAFKDYRFDKGIFGSDWVFFDNFKFFFQSQDASRVTINTIGYNLVFIATVIAGSVFVALLLNELRSKIAIKTYQTVFFLPYFLSYTVVAYIVYAFLDFDYGILNRVLESLGHEGILWYNEPKYWRVLLPVIHFWKAFGYNAIIFYAGLLSIDPGYYEAAMLDGANKFQQAYYITIPHLTSLMVTMTILMIGKIFRADFGLFFMVPKDAGALYSATDVIDTYVYRSLRVSGDVGLSTAIGLFQSVVGLITVLASNYLVKRIDQESALF